MELTEVKQWQRPDQLQIKREKGWGYKYFRKNDVERRMLEGWEVCNKGEKDSHETNPLDRAQHYRSLILMRMPIHMIEQRNNFYLEKHRRRLRASAKGAAVAGEAARVNSATGNDGPEKLTGAIGKGLTLKQGVVTNEGLIHTHNEHIGIGDDEEVNLEDMRDLHEVRKAQAETDAEAEDGGSPSSISKSKKRR